MLAGPQADDGSESWNALKSATSDKPVAPKVAVKKESAASLDLSFEGFGFSEDFAEKDQTEYTQLSVPGCGSSGKVGEPEMPFKGVWLEVPWGVEVSAYIKDLDYETYSAISDVMPAQPPRPNPSDKEPPFEKSDESYAKNALFPASPVEIDTVGFIRGRRVAFVKVYPMQYNPASGEMFVFSKINFGLEYSGKADTETEAKERARLLSPAFEKSAERTVLNYKPTEAVASEKSAATAPSGRAGPLMAINGLWDPPSPGADYLIIVDDALYQGCVDQYGANLLDKLAEWKTKKGYLVRLATMTEVNNFGGGSAPSNIYDYIHDAYVNWSPAPTYVLLVGDFNTVPPYDVGTLVFLEPSSWYSDHYYSLQQSLFDYWSDLFISRIPASTVADCQNSLTKTLKYDSNPDIPTDDWYNRALMSSAFLDSNPPPPLPPPRQCIEDKFFAELLWPPQDFMEGLGYDVTTALSANVTCDQYFPRAAQGATYPHQRYVPSPLPYADGNPDPYQMVSPAIWPTRIVGAFNGGIGLAYYKGHGYEDDVLFNGQWTATFGWGNDVGNNFFPADVDILNQNNNATPFVFSIACKLGKFAPDDSGPPLPPMMLPSRSLSQALVLAQTRGAVAAIGPSEGTWAGPNELIALGLFTSIWLNFDPTNNITNIDGSSRLSEMLNYAKLYMYTYGHSENDPEEGDKRHSYLYHAFGDPELEYRPVKPRDISADVYYAKAVCSGEDKFKVLGAPDGALIGVSQEVAGSNVKPLGRVFSDGGEALFDLRYPVEGSGDVVLTITGRDVKPYQVTIPVCCRYVNVNNPTPGNGTTWATAFTTIQGGINAAAAAAATQGACNTIVAPGTYYTYTTSQQNMVILKDNVHVYGSFDPTKHSLWDRGDGITYISGYKQGGQQRVYHVLSNKELYSGGTMHNNWTLDGVWVVYGNANGSTAPDNQGGGMYLQLASYNYWARLENVTFAYNNAMGGGAGLYTNVSAPYLKNVHFLSNQASMIGGVPGYGGGLLVSYGGTRCDDCSFENNVSSGYGGYGGGAYFNRCWSYILRGTFKNNSAAGQGGG
ncbi:MAG: C25 family cysteine peptidase, partial [Deltaproteobacteria bacterium]|nr:C25 family cysteine peptidase [Deltaproteobacteria bacterium]